jgi:hypothetical protein
MFELHVQYGFYSIGSDVHYLVQNSLSLIPIVKDVRDHKVHVYTPYIFQSLSTFLQTILISLKKISFFNISYKKFLYIIIGPMQVSCSVYVFSVDTARITVCRRISF